MKLKHKNLLMVVLIVIFILRLFFITNSPLEEGDNWRQPDTESIARNFVEYRFNIFYPNFNYDGPLPNIPALEIQIYTFLTAILYKLFGSHYFLPRLISTLFFMGSCFYFYLIGKKYLTKEGAIFGLILYGIIPINMFYSRAIMPESAALLFFLGGFYHFDRWMDIRKNGQLFLSGLFIALALMIKPPVVFMGISMLYLLYKKYRWRWLKNRNLWTYGISILLISGLYYYLSNSISNMRFVFAIAQKHIFTRFATDFYTPEAIAFYKQQIPRALTLIGVLLIPLGLILSSKRQIPLVIWFIAMTLGVLVIVGVIKFYYYLIFFTAVACFIMGNALGWMYKVHYLKPVAFILLGILAYSSFTIVRPMYSINQAMETQAKVIREVTDNEDLVVLSAINPGILGAANRRGWRFNIKYYSHIPEDPYEELQYYIDQGAKFFSPVKGRIYGDNNGEIKNFLEQNYEKIEPIEGYPIYKLR